MEDTFEQSSDQEKVNNNDNLSAKENNDSNSETENDIQDDLKKSVLNITGLLGPTHPGRPANEEPHVKKTMKNKKEKIELICRIDQDELGFQEDEYDDLKALFMVSTRIASTFICDSRENENIAKHLTLTAEFSSFLTMTMMEW